MQKDNRRDYPKKNNFRKKYDRGYGKSQAGVNPGSVKMEENYGPYRKGQVYQVSDVGHDWYRFTSGKMIVPFHLTTTNIEVEREREDRDENYNDFQD